MAHRKPASLTLARRRSLFERRAKELQRAALSELRAQFPPWYVRSESGFQRAFVQGCVGSALAAALLSVASYALGWPGWLLAACCLAAGILFVATLAFLVLTAIAAWAWTRRHHGHPYASAFARQQASRVARDIYPFRHQVLEELRGRLSASQLDDLRALMPLALAERAKDRPRWTKAERRFWRRYHDFMSRAEPRSR